MCAVSVNPAGLVQVGASVNVSWVKWNLNIVIVPLSIFKQITEVEYKETEMGYREINMEIILQALDKLIKLGNAARFSFLAHKHSSTFATRG